MSHDIDATNVWTFRYKTVHLHFVYRFQAHGPVGKMTANPLIVTETGRWMLPYWQVESNSCKIVTYFIIITLMNLMVEQDFN